MLPVCSRARCAARLFPPLSPSLISLVSTGRALKGPYVRFTRRSPALRRLLSAPLARSPNALTAGGALEPCGSGKFSLMQLFPRLYADSFVCVPSVGSGAPSRIACDFFSFSRFVRSFRASFVTFERSRAFVCSFVVVKRMRLRGGAVVACTSNVGSLKNGPRLRSCFPSFSPPPRRGILKRVFFSKYCVPFCVVFVCASFPTSQFS